MKTPEEMAIDYCEPILSDDYARAIGREDWIGTRCVKVGEGHEMYNAFLAGYRAAKDQVIKEVEFYRQQEKIIFLLKNYAATIHTNSVWDALKDFIGQLESIVGKTVANHIPQSEKMDQTTNVNGMRFCIYCNDFHGGACAELRGKNHPALNQTNLPTSAKWISVKERLPETLESVLVVYAPTNEAKNDYRMECWNWPETEVYETKFITHWMPLPEPPKEDK